jgi:hypothetical protein
MPATTRQSWRGNLGSTTTRRWRRRRVGRASRRSTRRADWRAMTAHQGATRRLRSRCSHVVERQILRAFSNKRWAKVRFREPSGFGSTGRFHVCHIRINLSRVEKLVLNSLKHDLKAKTKKLKRKVLKIEWEPLSSQTNLKKKKVS